MDDGRRKLCESRRKEKSGDREARRAGADSRSAKCGGDEDGKRRSRIDVSMTPATRNPRKTGGYVSNY